VTVVDALRTIGRVGSIEVAGRKLKLKFPERDSASLQPAIEVLRSHKDVALAMLSDPLDDHGMSWAQWKASSLNWLFQDLGTSGRPARITAEAVHGERKRGRP
jgi:hypothetical protein